MVRPGALECSPLLFVHFFPSSLPSLMILITHDMCPPSAESVDFKDNTNGTSLLIILPTSSGMLSIRETPGRLTMVPASQQRPHHIPLYQGKTVLIHHPTGCSFQFSVRRLSSITLQVAVGNSFSERPSYLSKRWTVSIHPEGKFYAP